MDTNEHKTIIEYDRDVGGMYNILKLYHELLINKLREEELSVKDIMQLTNINRISCSHNINKLVKAGLLIRIEKKNKGCNGGRDVKYKLGGDTIELLRARLYD